MIKLTTYQGEPVYVNAVKIHAITDHPSGGACVWLGPHDNDYWIVNESVDEILGLLRSDQ